MVRDALCLVAPSEVLRECNRVRVNLLFVFLQRFVSERDPRKAVIWQPSAETRSSGHWPYINQEDLLARSKTLLPLLNARGRHPPCDFAAARCVKWKSTDRR